MAWLDNPQVAIADWYARNGGHASINAAIDRAVEECRELNFASGTVDIREETADVAMCLFMVAQIAGFDLIEAVREKLRINEQRRWTVDADGCLHHVKGSDPRESLAQGGSPPAAAGKEKIACNNVLCQLAGMHTPNCKQGGS
jgi:NTP pyrophosphatase (non-canonical NTP hydrolase)